RAGPAGPVLRAAGPGRSGRIEPGRDRRDAVASGTRLRPPRAAGCGGEGARCGWPERAMSRPVTRSARRPGRRCGMSVKANGAWSRPQAGLTLRAATVFAVVGTGPPSRGLARGGTAAPRPSGTAIEHWPGPSGSRRFIGLLSLHGPRDPSLGGRAMRPIRRGGTMRPTLLRSIGVALAVAITGMVMVSRAGSECTNPILLDTPIPFTTGPNAHFMVAGDFNEDGTLDLAVTNGDLSQGSFNAS